MQEMTIREIQKATKELLVVFDDLCNTLNIRYFLLFGSMIGAVRHHGFIPWDDDLDVGMTHDDYKVLVQYFENNTDADIELHNQKTRKDCFYNIARVCDKKHILYFDNKKYTSGVFVDIYVMEGLGSDGDRAYWRDRFKKYPRWQKCVYMVSSASLLYGKGAVHKLLNIPTCIIAKVRGKKHYIDLLNSFKSFAMDESKYVGFPSWETTIYEKEWFDKLIRVGFEDIEVWIPERYDEILTAEYGEYMQLPPENDRVPHHGYTAYRL